MTCVKCSTFRAHHRCDFCRGHLCDMCCVIEIERLCDEYIAEADEADRQADAAMRAMERGPA
jgi:hypothetical protein